MARRSDEPPDSLPDGSEQWPANADPALRSARARAAAAARTVQADDGNWRVYELDSDAYDRRSSQSLIFESDGVFRRVRDYPPDWRELSDEELMVLSWRR